jgi:hypothetical protein
MIPTKPEFDSGHLAQTGVLPMKETRECVTPKTPEPAGVELGKWMGRREAFGVMAAAALRRCEACAHPRKKIYRVGLHLGEFCSRHCMLRAAASIGRSAISGVWPQFFT